MKATTFVFPHETLTKIDGIPTHESMTLIRKELYANAYANECTLGGGDNGYLGLIMPTEKYIQLQRDNNVTRPIEFKQPDPPDPTASATVITTTSKIILDCKTMEAQLKQQLLAAVDREYLNALDDDCMGLGQVKAKALLAFMEKKYDIITYDEIIANRAKLDEPWDASEPIHKLWSRTLKVQRFATAGKKPIDDDTAMHALLNVLKDTGVFMTHITIWKQKPVNTWTMSAFQEFFDEANRERDTHTAKEAGYANAVKTGPKSTTERANIATSDTGIAHDKYIMTFGNQKVYYCWSHGGGTNAKHTSATCNRPKSGHINLATWDNTCGGCTDILISQQNKNYRYRRNNNRNDNDNNGSNNNSGGNNSGSNHNGSNRSTSNANANSRNNNGNTQNNN
jgi:hypothetical protein